MVRGRARRKHVSFTAYATSSDGLNWTKYAGNPVMSPSAAWEGGSGASNHEDSPTAILKEDGVYKLWYHGIRNTTRQIGYAESVDGITWTKYAGTRCSRPERRAAWDADSVCEPRVLRVGAQYYMFYTRCTGTHGIGLATSPDGKSWTKYAGNPVLAAAPGNVWDNLQVSWGEVYYDGQRFYMWYPGRKTSRHRRLLARRRHEHRRKGLDTQPEQPGDDATRVSPQQGRRPRRRIVTDRHADGRHHARLLRRISILLS